jgi:hypothetical protein
MIPQKLSSKWDISMTALIFRRKVPLSICAAGCDWRAYEFSLNDWTE